MTRAAAPEAIPYLLLGETRRRSLQERLGILVDRWYRTWAPETAAEPHAELSNDVTPTIRGETWTFVASQSEQPVLQVTVPVDFLRMLGGGPGVGALTTTVEASNGGLAALLTENIVAALCTDILHSALPATAGTVRRLGRAGGIAVTRPGSGAQTLMVSIATDRPRPALEVLLTSSVVDALLVERPVIPRGEPMAGRRKAAGAVVLLKRLMPGIAARRTQGGIVKVLARTSVTNSLHAHVLEIDTIRVLIVEGRNGVSLTLLPRADSNEKSPST